VLESAVVKTTTAGASGAKPAYFFLERYIRAYAAEWHAFIAAVESGSPVPVGLQDGINALALAEAAGLSAREGRTVTL
jgi:myo-inositol 2-dehydrogenase / D-chiro-inositol 1-dehydrogenase